MTDQPRDLAAEVERWRSMYMSAIAVIADTQEALGFDETDVSTANGSAEIVDAIEGLQESVAALSREVDTTARQLRELSDWSLNLKTISDLRAEIARLSSPPQERAEIVERESVYRHNCGPFGHLSQEQGSQVFADLATLLGDCAAWRNAHGLVTIERDEARTSLSHLRANYDALYPVAIKDRERIERLEAERDQLKAAKLQHDTLQQAAALALHDERIERLEGALRVSPAMVQRAFSVMRKFDCFFLFADDTLRTLIVDWLGVALAASQQHTAARTPEQYAIEHGRYLATRARQFMDACNSVHAAQEAFDDCDDKEEEQRLTEALEHAQEARGDAWQGLQSSIYEFTKRADRAYPLKQHTAGSGDSVAGD